MPGSSGARPRTSVFGLVSDDELELDRWVDELGEHIEVAPRLGRGLLGEASRQAGELDLDPVVSRLARSARFLVAEINEPDPARSPDMKAAYPGDRARRDPPGRGRSPPPRADPFDWQAVVGRRDPVPSLLELQERYERSILLTGGAGSIGSALTTTIAGFRPAAITVLDAHEAALTADRRRRGGGVRHVLCTSAMQAGSSASWPKHARTSSSTWPRTSTWTGPSSPEEFVDTNLHGSWNVLAAAERAARRDRRRRLSGQGGARGELLRPHEALHGAAHRLRRPARGRQKDRRSVRERPRDGR